MLADLKKFLLRGNVVDLAVAVVIGAAFGLVVQSFIDNIINPIIAAIFGKPDISRVLTFTLKETDEGDAILSLGGFLQEVLNFAIIGFALFMVVQAFNKLQERRKAGEVEEEPEPSDEVVLLTEIRDALRTRG